MAREVRQPGVELHGNSYRFRHRVQSTVTKGKKRTLTKRVASYERWPFYTDKVAAAMGLRADHPKRRSNALAQANAYAIRVRSNHDAPQWVDEAKRARSGVEGTLLEWMLRYRDEALRGHRYGLEGVALPFVVEGRAAESIKHDESQIRTIQALAETHRDIADFLATDITKLQKTQFARLLMLWAEGKAAPATKRRLLSTFASIWDHHSAHYEMEAEREWKKVKIGGDGRKPKARALTLEELDKIEQKLDRLDPVTRAAIEFIRWTGCRRSEAAKLRWENITWPKTKRTMPSVLFTRTKAKRGTFKERYTYIEPECVVALRRMFGPDLGQKFTWPKEGWVFPQPRPKDKNAPPNHIAGQTIYTAFKRSLVLAQVPHASPHHLRHTKATQLSVTMSQGQAMELLGHSDAATFAIYRHLAEQSGYLVRGMGGKLVSAEQMKQEESLMEAFAGRSPEDQAKLIAELMAMMAKKSAEKEPEGKTAEVEEQ